jgi:hypothetical protein
MFGNHVNYKSIDLHLGIPECQIYHSALTGTKSQIDFKPASCWITHCDFFKESSFSCLAVTVYGPIKSTHIVSQGFLGRLYLYLYKYNQFIRYFSWGFYD